ncbi:homeobox protein Nkx-6.1-like [Frankliniella occidentalis]|uniref:Homeobox protein Nkx-6.1-like n=1 Tax=Frankliniella occidentalis TaxID=133901 RepID=A0A9C6WWS6_FRAOC|nr:homeobox protein Nkx-6.1-like [Frankliniella occidentalis]
MEAVGVAGASHLYHFGHHNYAPGGPKIPATAPVADWMHEVPVGLFTVGRAVTELRTTPPALRAMGALGALGALSSPTNTAPAATLYRSPPPSAPPADDHELPTSPTRTSATTSARRPALPLGADMAGGDARVADGRESSASSSRESSSPAVEPPRDTPKDPHMFLAPSLRSALSSSSSSNTALELRSRLGSAGQDAAAAMAGGGGGLQRGPGAGAPGDAGGLDAAGSATSRF